MMNILLIIGIIGSSLSVSILAYIVLTYIAEIIKYPLLGMSDTAWTLILVGIYFVYALLPMFLNYQYIHFSDEGENIVIRYFTAGIIGGRKNSIEINKSGFAGYKSEARFFGMIKSLTLYQKVQKGIATYPPVYISALSAEERSKLFRSLNQYAVRE